MKKIFALLLFLTLTFGAIGGVGAQADDSDFDPTATDASCTNPHDKKAIVGTTDDMWELYAAGADFLCTKAGTWYYDRTIGTNTAGGGAFYRQVPFVRSFADLNAFCSAEANWASYVLFADAPTRTVAQGGTYMTAEQTGDLAKAIADCAPFAKLVGPVSDLNVMTGADGVPSDWLYRMQQRYINQGGNVGRWTDAGLLLYPDRFAGQSPETMLQNYSARMLYVTGDDPTANLFVETRWGNTWAHPMSNMESLMDRFMGQSVVQYVFGHQVEGPSLYRFRAANIAQLTGSGAGYRASGW